MELDALWNLKCKVIIDLFENSVKTRSAVTSNPLVRLYLGKAVYSASPQGIISLCVPSHKAFNECVGRQIQYTQRGVIIHLGGGGGGSSQGRSTSPSPHPVIDGIVSRDELVPRDLLVISRNVSLLSFRLPHQKISRQFCLSKNKKENLQSDNCINLLSRWSFWFRGLFRVVLNPLENVLLDFR